MAVLKKEFFSDEVCRGSHRADLGLYGEFWGRYILVDPHAPNSIVACGSLYTMPRHLDDPITIDVELYIDLDPFWDVGCDFPPPDVVEKMTASDLFSAPWQSWGTSDIPVEWEY